MYEHALPRRDERRPAAAVPLPEHALLALQRSAGNHAVTRMLARSKFSSGEVRDEVKFALNPRGGTPPTTKTALLLAVYNQIRVTLDPTPAEYTNVIAATKSLKQRGKIDDEDVTAFDSAAGQALGLEAAEDPAVTRAKKLKNQIEDKRPGIDAKHRKHIFDGDLKGESPTGYHSIKGKTPSATHEAYGAKTQVANDVAGVYQRSVRLVGQPTKRKANQSTFFPDTATEDEVLDAITSVYGFKPRPAKVTYPESLKGPQLATRGETVYPAGGDDHLGPE
jgi:hypothetical protein